MSSAHWKAPRFNIHFEGSNIHGEIKPGRIIEGTVVIFVRMYKDHQPLLVHGIHVGLRKTNSQMHTFIHFPETFVTFDEYLHETTKCKIMNAPNHPHYLQEGYHKLPFSIQIPSTWVNDKAFLEATLHGDYDYKWTNSTTIIEIDKNSETFDINQDPENALPQELNVSETIVNTSWFSCCNSIQRRTNNSEEKMHFNFKIPRKGFLPGERIFLTAEIRNNSSKSISETAIEVCEKLENGKHVPLQSIYLRKVKSHTSDKFEMAIRLPSNIKTSKEIKHYLKFNVVTSGSGDTFVYNLPICIGSAPLKTRCN